jgi:hypothetical protein
LHEWINPGATSFQQNLKLFEIVTMRGAYFFCRGGNSNHEEKEIAPTKKRGPFGPRSQRNTIYAPTNAGSTP